MVGDVIWLSIPNDYDQLNSNVDVSLTTVGLALSMATNAIATMLIAYKLWYVAVGSVYWISGSA